VAKDYKRSSQAKKKRSSGRTLPGWAWGLSGLAIGLFVALLVHLNEQNPNGPQSIRDFLKHSEGTSATAPTGSKPDHAAGEQQQQQQPQQEKPKFEFYKLLPQQKVEVPEEEAPKTPPETAHEGVPEPSAKPAPESSGAGTQYLLQAGSFQNHKDADRLKARLALIGVEAHIQTVELEGGETWHRVRIGPFTDQANLNGVRRRLKSNGFETILLKRSG